jgi:hypothetical protein
MLFGRLRIVTFVHDSCFAKNVDLASSHIGYGRISCSSWPEQVNV